MRLIYFDYQIFEVTTDVCKERTKWQIEQKLIHMRVIKLEYCQNNDPCRIFDHGLSMIEKFASYGQQWKVICPFIHEKLDRSVINAESQRFEERDKCVHELFIVKIEFKRDQLVEEWVRQNVVYINKLEL